MTVAGRRRRRPRHTGHVTPDTQHVWGRAVLAAVGDDSVGLGETGAAADGQAGGGVEPNMTTPPGSTPVSSASAEVRNMPETPVRAHTTSHGAEVDGEGMCAPVKAFSRRTAPRRKFP